MGKKYKLIFMLIFAVWSCVGCAGSHSLQEAGFATEEEVNDRELIVVGFSQVGTESDWRMVNTESVKTSFTEEEGFYLLFDDAQQKQEKQIKAIRNFILQEVDYIIVNPIVETGWDVVLQEAKDAGIPVIVADRMVDVKDDDLYICWLGSDMEKEGENAGLWLADYLQEQGREKEDINIVTLQGTLGSTAQIGRTEGFGRILQEHDNWHMLGMQNGDFTQTKGQEAMEYLLQTYDDIDVVISENDNMTFGAIDAIREAGKTCGSDGEIIMISFDAVGAALDSLIAGDINADFECNPLQGPGLREIIRALENGEEVEKIQYMEETYFDTTMDLEALKEERTY